LLVNSTGFMPASHCFSIEMIFSSPDRDFFTSEFSCRKTLLLHGPDRLWVTPEPAELVLMPLGLLPL
jgi:hypothetical protein